MKKIQNALLSVLLFSFSFLVVHDYMMADLGISSYQEQSLERGCISADTTKSTLDAVSHLHDSIHTMIAMDSETSLESSLAPHNNPSYTQVGFATNNNIVLERPPLI